MYLALVIPGAYVLIPDAIKAVNPWARLRVLTAGVAANALLCVLAALLLLVDAPARLLTTPDPHGGAVLRSLPPYSPLHAALTPGDGIAALQDIPISDGAAELVGLLAAQAEATRARARALLRAATAATAAGEGGVGASSQRLDAASPSPSPPSLAALNATVAGLLAGDARGLAALEAAGLLAPEAFCTHLDLTEGEDEGDEGRPVPGCCAFDALVGRRPTTTDGGGAQGGDATSTSTCFAYLPVVGGKTQDAGEREEEERQKLRLTCLPARELALHSHVLGLLGGPLAGGSSKAARGDRGRPFCFRPVSVPPNVLFKVREEGRMAGWCVLWM